jgi:hypothetical protein
MKTMMFFLFHFPQLLIREHILSAPVLEHGRFVGFLDMKDLTHYVVFAVEENLKAHGRMKSKTPNVDGAEAVHMRHASHHVASPVPSLPSVADDVDAESAAAAVAVGVPPRSPRVSASALSRVHFLDAALQGINLMGENVAASITNSCTINTYEMEKRQYAYVFDACPAVHHILHSSFVLSSPLLVFLFSSQTWPVVTRTRSCRTQTRCTRPR